MFGISAGTLVSAAAGIGGALISADAAGDASEAQAQSAANAQALEREMFERNIELNEPWRQAGIGALGQLEAGTAGGGDFNRDFTLADFNRDPSYKFRMSEGLKGVEASAAARGGALSGGALKGIQQYGQEVASQEYGNAYNRFNADRDRRFNRLSSIAGLGQTATRDVAQQGSSMAGRVGDLMTQAGNARASGYVGSANAINQGLGTVANAFSGSNVAPRGGGAWDFGGYSASNDRGGLSWGDPGDWFQKYGSSGD